MTGEWSGDLADPLVEAEQRFVEPAWSAHPPAPRPTRELRILEVGFGRGLNTAVALKRLAAAAYPGLIRCRGLEPHPEWLQPWPPRPPGLPAPWWGEAEGDWPLPAPLRGTAEVRGLAAPRGLEPGWGADWLFLDLFSPADHPADWDPGLGQALAATAAPGAVLSSYCCARLLKDQLRAAGWQVQRLRRRGVRDCLRARLPKLDP